MSSAETSGPQGQFFLCSLLPGRLGFLGVINVNGTSVSAAVDEDTTPPASPSFLFSVEDEDDLFADKEFDGFQAAQDGAPNAAPPAPVASSISSVDDEDDLFGYREFEAFKTTKAASASADSSTPGSPDFLFSDDIEDDDLFGDKEYEAVQANKSASAGAASPTPGSPSSLFNGNIDDDDLFGDKEYEALQATKAASAGAASPTPGSPCSLFSGEIEDDDDLFGDKEFESFQAAQGSAAGATPDPPAASGEPEQESNNILDDDEFEELLSKEFDACRAAAEAEDAAEADRSASQPAPPDKTKAASINPSGVKYPYVGGLTVPFAPAAAPRQPTPSPFKSIFLPTAPAAAPAPTGNKVTLPTRGRPAKRPVTSTQADWAGDADQDGWVDPPDSLAARLRAGKQEKNNKNQTKQQQEVDPRSLMAPEPASPPRDNKNGQKKRKREPKPLSASAQALKDRVETQLANQTVAFHMRKLKRPWDNWKAGRRGPAAASEVPAAPRTLVSLQGVVSTSAALGGARNGAASAGTSSAATSVTPASTPSVTTSEEGGDAAPSGVAPAGDGAGNNAPAGTAAVVEGEEREKKRQATLARMRENGSPFVLLDDDDDEGAEGELD